MLIIDIHADWKRMIFKSGSDDTDGAWDSPDINLISYLWDELECQTKCSCGWNQILQPKNILKAIMRRLETVRATNDSN